MTKPDADLITPLPASDSGSAAVWASKRINPRPQSCLCLTCSGYPLNDDDDDGRCCIKSRRRTRRTRQKSSKSESESACLIVKFTEFIQTSSMSDENSQFGNYRSNFDFKAVFTEAKNKFYVFVNSF